MLNFSALNNIKKFIIYNMISGHLSHHSDIWKRGIFCVVIYFGGFFLINKMFTIAVNDLQTYRTGIVMIHLWGNLHRGISVWNWKNVKKETWIHAINHGVMNEEVETKDLMYKK